MRELQTNSLAHILKIIIHLYLEILRYETQLLKAGPPKAGQPGPQPVKAMSVGNLFCCLTNQRVNK